MRKTTYKKHLFPTWQQKRNNRVIFISVWYDKLLRYKLIIYGGWESVRSNQEDEGSDRYVGKAKGCVHRWESIRRGRSWAS